MDVSHHKHHANARTCQLLFTHMLITPKLCLDLFLQDLFKRMMSFKGPLKSRHPVQRCISSASSPALSFSPPPAGR